MMQNTNFVYHPESLIEMQLICVFLVYVLNNGIFYSYSPSSWKAYEHSDSSNFIMFTLLCEHIFSYLIAFFRHYDINKNGRMDINGVKRASNESKLSSL
jgi:hypothetical protein